MAELVRDTQKLRYYWFLLWALRIFDSIVIKLSYNYFLSQLSHISM